MPRFKVWFSKCYEIEVEAENESEAFDAAYEIPLSEWWDEHCGETGIENVTPEEESENV